MGGAMRRDEVPDPWTGQRLDGYQERLKVYIRLKIQPCRSDKRKNLNRRSRASLAVHTANIEPAISGTANTDLPCRRLNGE